MTQLDRLRLISRLFSRPVLEEMARHGLTTAMVDTFKALGIWSAKESRTVGELFETALKEINKSYRCEYVYKAAIANRIVYGRHSPRTSSLAVELGVDNSIVDAAVFNGTTTAYEVKTEFDNPSRLTTQAPAYLRAFDRVNVVTHPRNGARYVELLDSRIGVLVLNRDNSISTLRPAIGDTSRIEPGVVFRMLRRDEFMKVVHTHFGPQPKLPNGVITAHYRELFEKLSSHQAHEALLTSMRARTNGESSVSFLTSLPPSLRVLGYATPLSAPQRSRALVSLATAI
ncbi:sce7726 family protein [Comamonas testosteroni]|uniref:Sce7726 family protein n=1 Tax=Comamonas testosteroni (strain DSM 14576 / KF-1) TaxID=399795 RepID=B7WV92_COMTK|nr:sce7726 family protein [Comamonas testosteroni]EED65684.1 conserved hypothetical protein [Comamonas testosteroni KF-1]WQG69083.1 sce7726 family protein [Comamonas testosteroni]